MPYSNSNVLNVFFSYVSEDGSIADSLAKTLRMAFGGFLDITMMGEFPSGLNWRRLIDDSIADTDILIAIATGTLKPSHSFTGLEIGSFSFSMRSTPEMRKFPGLRRRMIPFAVLAAVPATASEFEGIDIDPDQLLDVRFDADNLASNLEGLFNNRDGNAIDAKLFKLLADMDDILTDAGIATRTTIQIEERIRLLRGYSRALCKDIFENMFNREQSIVIPKSKLIIKIPPPYSDNLNHNAIENATFKIEGPCFDSFGISDGIRRPFTWTEFTAKADDHDISFAWREAIVGLLSSTQRSNFVDNNIILSFDRKRLFRIFTSKSIRYYSKAAEFHIYVIEMLHSKDYGDPSTTLLLKAMEVGLGYRFMFLETTSEFSPTVFRGTEIGRIKERVLDMLNGLNLLLRTAEEYNLNGPRSALEILGPGAAETLEEKYDIWNREKCALYNIAKRILKSRREDPQDKKELVRVLTSFCEETRMMNEEYTASVLKLLQDKIKKHSLSPTLGGMLVRA